MTDLDSLQFDQTAIYQIKVKGRLDERWKLTDRDPQVPAWKNILRTP